MWAQWRTTGVALHGFAERLRIKYEPRRVERELEDHALRFRSRAVVDAILSAASERAPCADAPVSSIAASMNDMASRRSFQILVW